MHTHDKLKEVQQIVKDRYSEEILGVGIGENLVIVYIPNNSYTFPSEIDGVELELVLVDPQAIEV